MIKKQSHLKGLLRTGRLLIYNVFQNCGCKLSYFVLKTSLVVQHNTTMSFFKCKNLQFFATFYMHVTGKMVRINVVTIDVLYQSPKFGTSYMYIYLKKSVFFMSSKLEIG